MRQSTFFCTATRYRITALLLTLVGINCPRLALSQDTRIVTLYQPVTRVCEGQVSEFDLDAPFQGDKPVPRDNFYSFYDENACTFRYDKNVDNSSLKIEGAGVGDHTITRLNNGNYRVRVTFTKTGPYRILWQQTDFYPVNNCGQATEVVHKYEFTSTKVVVIAKPPTPILTATKAVVNYPESITISSADCPNSLAGETEYPYSVNSAFKAWSFDCNTDGKPWFRDNFALSPRDSYFLYAPGYFYYKPGTVFRAQCNDNGCLSEVSSPLAVSYKKTISDCGDSDLTDVDNFTSEGRQDYHHYTVETVVCSKADGNPNCTQKAIFDLLKSSKTYAAVIAEDFPGAVPISPSALRAKTNLFGSDMVFKVTSTSVTNCETVNLASTLGLALNMVALDAYQQFGDESLLGITRYATSLNPIANPITQYIDESTFTITNYTKLGHILHPGKITRIVVDECDRIKILTIGSGRHFFGNNSAGTTMALINTFSGIKLFTNVDKRVVEAFNKLPR